jgi:CRP-like cAMP-binding protein
MDALTQLKQFISAVHPLPEEDVNALTSVWTALTAKRKEVLTKPLEQERYLYFITEGVQRVYYYDEMSREATLVFTYAPSFGGVIDSMLLQRPSRYYYETLTPSAFLRVPFSEIQKLMLRYPSVRTLIEKGTAQALSGVLERLVELQCFSSEEKFKSLLQRSPHILQLVPHKYLANYLGIDATNFSKFINRIKI